MICPILCWGKLEKNGRQAGGGGFGQEPAEAQKEVLVIGFIPEDGGAVYSAHDDMVKGAGGVDAGLARHGA